LDDINIQLTELQRAVSALAEHVGIILGRLEELEYQISDLDSRIDIAEANISTSFSNADTLQGNIRRLASNLDDVAQVANNANRHAHSHSRW